METSISPALGAEPVAQCGRLNEPEKDEKQTSLAEESAITKVIPHIDIAETSTLETASGHKDIDACPQEKELENAEINIVIDVKTDAESGQESGIQGEENMPREADSLGEHGKLFTFPQQGSERDSPDTASEAAQQHTGKSSVDSVEQQDLVVLAISNQVTPEDRSPSSQIHETVESAVKIANIQKDVGKEEYTAVRSSDGIEGLGSKGGEHHSVTEVQARADSERLNLEETLASTSDLDNKVLNMLDLASGSTQRLESAINEEEQRLNNVGESAEMKVEADSGIMPCRKGTVEEHVHEFGLHTIELSGVVDIERKKALMAEEDSAEVAQHGSELLATQADMLPCTKAGEVNIVQCLESNLGEVVRDITRDQGSASLMAQTEQKANRFDTEIEGVRSGSLQSSEGMDRVQESIECVKETAVLREAEGDKDAISKLGKSHIIVQEGMMGGRQEPSCEKEVGTLKKTPDIDSLESSWVMERGTGLGNKHIVTEGKKCHLDNIGAGDQHPLTDHIEVQSSKNFYEVLQVGQEAISDMIGLDTRTASAAPCLLQFPRSNSVTVENSHTDGLQLERQQSQKLHTEMQVRLEAETPHGVEGGSGRVSRDLPPSRSYEVKEEVQGSMGQHWRVGIVMNVKTKADTPVEDKPERHKDTIVRDVLEEHQGWDFQGIGHDNSLHQIARHGFEEEKTGLSDEANTGTSEEERIFGGQLERGRTIQKASQKRKLSDNVVSDSGAANEHGQNDSVVKKAKKKAVNVWAKTTSRKGPKKNSKNGGPQNPSNENSVLLTPVYANPDKVEDGLDQPIALSKHDKAEKIELSEDRLSASSTKGYRMVRATRGVQEGTWYYEIVVEQLGPTGHTRLGWSTQKGDVQAPVGFDSNSYGYRDLDGSKTHVAIREPYGDLYVEGDVIGFYVHLPNGAEYAPKPAPLLSYKGRPYLSDAKEEQPRRVPGSEICFFRNGVCQGTAFRDLYGGRYFPAASMYTLPKEPSCIVRFNFGPDFRYPPVDLDGRPSPTAMVHAPYHNALGGKEVAPVAYANISGTGLGTPSMEPQMKIV